jgi:hypothetical protein
LGEARVEGLKKSDPLRTSDGRNIHFLKYRALDRAIEYFHIETEIHDAILANSAAP